MSIQQDLTERKLKDLEYAVEDLTTLAHSPGCAQIIGQSNLPSLVHRLNELRMETQLLQAAE